MLNKIKTLLNITDTSKDDLLNTLISKAIDYALQFTRNPGCTDLIENVIVDMVVFDYNRLGTEGLTSEGYSGVSFSYAPDYPEAILRTLRRFRKVGTIC